VLLHSNENVDWFLVGRLLVLFALIFVGVEEVVWPCALVLVRVLEVKYQNGS
jgi:hypothetical protein